MLIPLKNLWWGIVSGKIIWHISKVFYVPFTFQYSNETVTSINANALHIFLYFTDLNIFDKIRLLLEHNLMRLVFKEYLKMLFFFILALLYQYFDLKNVVHILKLFTLNIINTVINQYQWYQMHIFLYFTYVNIQDKQKKGMR